MEDVLINDEWLKVTNSELEVSITHRDRVEPRVLVLYWENGDEGFKTECQEVCRTFRDSFGYRTEQYAIPSEGAEYNLLSRITALLGDSRMTVLVIFYGGHGDLNDHTHSGEECQSVWAECGSSGQGSTLRWYKIQQNMRDSSADILLVLDCCYAAQAGRGTDSRRGRFEILAAAARRVQTPGPGARSFTTILLNEIRREVDRKGSIDIKETHGRLCAREFGLHATPVHITLTPGHTSMKLERLVAPDHPQTGRSQAASTFLYILLKVRENCTTGNGEEFRKWLRNDIPRFISRMRVTDQPEGAGETQSTVAAAQQNWFTSIDDASRADIRKAWEKVPALINGHELHYSEAQDTPSDEETREFRARLNAQCGEVVDTVERGILASSIATEEKELESAMGNEVLQKLQVANQLRLRQIVIELPGEDQRRTIADGTPYLSMGEPLLKEYKGYGLHFGPREIQSIRVRVEKLAALLKAPKSSGFRALRCIDVTHRPSERHFEFSFEVPHGAEGCTWTQRPDQSLNFDVESAADRGWVALHELILDSGKRQRPSLNQRLRISLQLSKAVQKWHSVGWVHQGITSANVIFFRRDGSVDYDEPFLHGFSFSRPDADPSLGREASILEVNLYRHPDLQGPDRQGYQKIHDIYSLGVVMLEIGLWQTAGQMAVSSRSRESQPSPSEVQKRLQRNCKDRLPHFAGEAYQSAVAACLTSTCAVDVDDKAGSYLGRAFQARVIDEVAKGVRV